MKIKYFSQLKHQALKKKYFKKIVTVVSQNKFNEEITKNHLLKLLNNNNKNELIDDIKKLKNTKNFNYFIKIRDSYKGHDLSLCLNVKIRKEEKIKLCVRINEKGLSYLEVSKEMEEFIDFIKKEIILDLFQGLV